MDAKAWLASRVALLDNCQTREDYIMFLQSCPFVQNAMFEFGIWSVIEGKTQQYEKSIEACIDYIDSIQWAFRKAENVATEKQVKELVIALNGRCRDWESIKKNLTARKEEANEKGLVER